METLNYILVLIIIAGLLWFFLVYKRRTVEPFEPREARAHPGTNTVFVGIFLDNNGKIGTTSKGERTTPGQKMILQAQEGLALLVLAQPSGLDWIIEGAVSPQFCDV